MPLTDDIKSLALDAGFHSVGITGAEPFVEAEAALLERFEGGLLQGTGFDLDYISAYTLPTCTLPSARSIISVALSYLTDDLDDPDPSTINRQPSPPKGWIARFSRGLDYHTVLQERLSALAESIQTRLGHRCEIRAFADTGPIVDRSAAIRSGIGSHGKNTCVYVGEYKSWVVLGELLTDLELEPDNPAPLEICGECNECVKACPTGAICAPYVVDVRICLSQVTQSKGFIPHWLREKMGTRVYGCDTCQSACPLNKDAKPGNVDAFRPSAGLGKSPELLPLLRISSEEFKARVAPTAAGWIKRTRIRRNAAIALGNLRSEEAVPGLIEALVDPEPLVRGHAAWALGKIGTGPARLALDKALAIETDAHVMTEIRDAMDMSSVSHGT